MGKTSEMGFGIIGLGRGRHGVRTIGNTEGAKLMAVCDLQEDKAKKIAEENGCDWTLEYGDLLTRKDIDVIGIYTSSGTHCEIAVEALNAGKHVYVTKPMDVYTEPCTKAIETADKKGLVLAVDFGRRYNAQFRRMARDIRNGAIGRIMVADLRIKWFRTQGYYDGGYPPGWRKSTRTEGGSASNQGVHGIDLFMWLIGKIKDVYGVKRTLNHDMETEDATAAILTLEEGGIGTIVTTTCADPPSGDTIEINGTKGSISWGKEAQPYESKEEYAGEPAGEIGNNIIEDMLLAINEGIPPNVDGREGRKSVELIEAIYRSSETGELIPLKYQ
jgi:UDP-N-acetyl-2-amino-2-deoxyglucuronate dehydrogenase